MGAAGVLIYSDPRDDGAVTAENGYEAYPAGPARNPTSVQRGSVQFLSLYPGKHMFNRVCNFASINTNAGDPTTPGYPAYENATRTEGQNIPKIPSLPISWANAQRLLSEISHDHDARSLTGQVSETKVRLVNHGMHDYKRDTGASAILTNCRSRHQGHAHLEHHGRYPRSHKERDGYDWLPSRW